MPNNRIFYASQGVSIQGSGAAADVTVNGAQSVSINTNYNLEQVFQLGRLAIYDNIAVDPEVEITINKALDGHELIWTLACGDTAPASNSIVGNANDTSTIILHVDDDQANFIDGAPTASITMTGCYVSSLNYTFPVDGNFTEEVTFVGSHKATGGQISAPIEDPLNRVARRQNFRLHGEGVSSTVVLPTAVRNKKLSSASISTDFGREKMFALGQVAPFHRYVNFPIEITVSFDVIQDGNGGTLAGTDFDVVTARCTGVNIVREPIKLVICDDQGNDSYVFDLGSGCALQSVSYSGGDTGGGNVTETYTYITYNELVISDYQDIAP